MDIALSQCFVIVTDPDVALAFYREALSLERNGVGRVDFRRITVGAGIVSEPADQFWGARDFAVRDPSGNLVRIAQA